MKSKKSVSRKKIRKLSRSRYYLRKHLDLAKSVVKLLTTAVIIAGAVNLFLFSDYFSVKKIIISGTNQFVNGTDVEQIAKSNAEGSNIVRFNTADLKNNLENSLLGAKYFEVKKRYPDTINILVHERVPIAIVYQNTEEMFLVDEDGYVLGFTSPDNDTLPKIHFEKEIEIGLFIDKNVVPVYLQLSKLFTQEKIKVSTMSFYPDHVNFKIERGPEVFIGRHKDHREAVRAISALLKQTKLEDKELKRVDMRYDKVIVLFK